MSEDRLRQLKELHKKRHLSVVDQTTFERERTRMLEGSQPEHEELPPGLESAATTPGREAVAAARGRLGGTEAHSIAPAPERPSSQPLSAAAAPPGPSVRVPQAAEAVVRAPHRGRGLAWLGFGFLILSAFLPVLASVPGRAKPAPVAPVATDRPPRIGDWVVVALEVTGWEAVPRPSSPSTASTEP